MSTAELEKRNADKVEKIRNVSSKHHKNFAGTVTSRKSHFKTFCDLHIHEDNEERTWYSPVPFLNARWQSIRYHRVEFCACSMKNFSSFASQITGLCFSLGIDTVCYSSTISVVNSPTLILAHVILQSQSINSKQ